MSKVVKGVGKIVKGVGKAVSGVVKGVTNVVKKVASSKIFKFAATAAALYFTGGAAMGGFSGMTSGWASAASSGAGFLGKVGGALSGAFKGAAAGLGSAWGGISNAASSIMGGNFSGALSSLANGVTGAGAAGANAVTGGLGQAFSTGINQVTNTGLMSTANATPLQQAMNSATTPVSGPTSIAGDATINTTASSGGLLSDPLTRAALINTGGNLIQGYAAGKAEEERIDMQREESERNRQRYNVNIGTPLFA